MAEAGQMLDGLRPRVAPIEALSLGSLALQAQVQRSLRLVVIVTKSDRILGEGKQTQK